MGDLILFAGWALGTAFLLGVAFALGYEISLSRGMKQMSHQIAWGRYRDSKDGIVTDHGNCLDHWDCPYD